MQHVFYSDGNTEKISWTIQTNNSIIEQNRVHPEIYFHKVSELQSKYIAFHVGLFWGIGTFIIKNEDEIISKIDNKKMYEHLALNQNIEDDFIEKRTQFIKQLILQRKLKVRFELISNEENISKKQENAEVLKTKNDQLLGDSSNACTNL